MLGALKYYLRLVLIPVLLAISIVTVFLTVFKDVTWGFYLLTSLLPQPNVKYQFHEYPLGKDIYDIFVFAILLGIAFQNKKFVKSQNTWLIVLIVLFSYFALWNSSSRFSLPWPITRANELLPEWKNYAEMILLYFLALNVLRKEDQQKKVVVLMSIVVLLISIRSYRNFSGGAAFNWDKRVGGPFEAAGLGANHFGAFIADYCSVFLGLYFFDKDRKRRILFLVTALFGLHPLFYSYSRGAYLAVVAVIGFFGVLKKRSMLVLVAVLLVAWHTILPASVVDRIRMTENESGQLENSAGGRLDLWKIAVDKFNESPLYGIGFGGYSLSVGGIMLSNGETVPTGFDTHNFWMKTLCEQGIIGASLLALILLKSFLSGWKLYKSSETDFFRGLGFGFMGCVIAIAITNLFGDRFSYFELGGYFWILWGLIDSNLHVAKDKLPGDILVPGNGTA